MKASGIEIDGEKRIKVEFPFDREIVDQVKQIGGARWSHTLKAWNIPYSIGAFEQLKKSFFMTGSVNLSCMMNLKYTSTEQVCE